MAELEAALPSERGPEPSVPSVDRAREQLTWLGVPETDIDPILATLPDPERSPELWRAFTYCHRIVSTDLGSIRPRISLPAAPSSLGAGYFYVHVYLSVLPLTLDWHRQHGIPAEITRATLSDLGVKVAAHRQGYGVGGFDKQNWLTRHFRCTLFRLGRLQFDRTRLDPTTYRDHPVPSDAPSPGDSVLEVHIPGDGPLTPPGCDESFALAGEFFRLHFPEEQHQHAICHSWLLDDQLADVLAPDSNIIRFQRRFQLFPWHLDSDQDILESVFGTPPGTADLDALPQSSTLQRAITTHLRAGHHWHLRGGHTPLPRN
jgi:hypothetical protein